MKKLRQFALAIVLIGTITGAYAKDFETLEDWGAKNKKWDHTSSGLTYVLGRCSGLLLALSATDNQTYLTDKKGVNHLK